MPPQRPVPAGQLLMFGISSRPMYNSPASSSAAIQTAPSRTSEAGSQTSLAADESANKVQSDSMRNSPAVPASTFQTASFRPRVTSPPPSVVAYAKANEVQSDSSSTVAKTDRIAKCRQQELFPCQQPITLKMRSKRARDQTFYHNSAAWPAHRISATPNEISEAGFYYSGERDRVKCWYCNGTLENWEIGDVPWQEHAKWFPLCEFLLQQKGIDYVRDISSLYPNLARPTLFNPTKSVSRDVVLSPLPYHNRDVPPSLHHSNQTEKPVFVDPRQKQREQLESKTEKEMVSSEIVSQARMMGFEDKDIRYALRKQFEKHNRGFTKFETLVDFLQQNEKNAIDECKRNLQDLEESRICKCCRKEPSCMVFIPCGHLACCVGCGTNAQSCPVCQSNVIERIRSYIS